MAQSKDRNARALADAVLALLRAHRATGDPKLLVTVRVPNSGAVDFRMSSDRWSVLLSRERARNLFVRATHRQVCDRVNHEATAARLTSRFLEVQGWRRRAALANGLNPSSDEALHPDAMAIDRVAAHLLAHRGVEPSEFLEWYRRFNDDHGNVETAIALGDPFDGVGAISATLSDGDTVPTLSCAIMIGSGTPVARLTGNVLQIGVAIPDTLLAASTGRRLGEVAATGIDMLDDRRITGAASTSTGVEFTLAVDLTTIGEARCGRRFRK